MMDNKRKRDLEEAGVASRAVIAAIERTEEYLVAARILLEKSDVVPSSDAAHLMALAQLIATADLALK